MSQLLLKNLSNSIWHAFNALKVDQQKDVVAKSKLKVLTANIGTIMDLYGVEKGLDHYKSTSYLTFKQYILYLQKEIFSTITDSTPAKTCRLYENKIEDICWILCRKMFVERQNPIFNDDCVYKLFRIFCLLGEIQSIQKTITLNNDDDDGNDDDDIVMMIIVTMHSDEVAKIASHIVSSVGLEWDSVDFTLLSSSIGGTFKFSTFLAVLESKYCGDNNEINNIAITESIQDLYQIYIEDVLKKGYLMKKGFILPTFKYFWFVLKPGELLYYKDLQQKEPSGIINLNLNCWADIALTTSHLSSSTSTSTVGCRFVLSTPEHKNIDLIADDHKGRLQWLAALKIAIQYANEKITYQRTIVNKRKSLRLAIKKQQTDITHELNYERQARIAAEIKTSKLEEITREEHERVKELEIIRKNLEILLVEEKQALKDEEIVRALQARVLTEEWEKLEQLEKLQYQQQKLLEIEKLKTREYENKQADNDKQLNDAKKRLAQLEYERDKLDNELDLARKKIQHNYIFNLQNIPTTSTIEQQQQQDKRHARMRRTQSLIPMTKNN
ncbi:hypothetical protein HCN44_004623 [Aphidius gifuensis]|uniref:PH domain-containing protein n=1 Tax=Aphidius gifuensis TaxID=684658 RepID=A0A834XZJ5_APHGI|nr:differentially expressed in FDCP 6 homolog [Aphidius gifuensis]KAF7995151.1 hypothetical protein HCN44_004623 [Aphidius gifuensis]